MCIWQDTWTWNIVAVFISNINIIICLIVFIIILNDRITLPVAALGLLADTFRDDEERGTIVGYAFGGLSLGIIGTVMN